LKIPKKVLLLVGSPRLEKSTSESLGNFMLSELEQQGFTSEKEYVYRMTFRKQNQDLLISKILESDLIILSSPLYVDSLPALVIKTFELIYDQDLNIKARFRGKGFCAIINSGFPESLQNNTALKICELFAKQVGLTWRGGLAIGGGGALSGRPLERIKGMARNIIRGLELAALNLAQGKIISKEAIDYAGKSIIAPTIYKLIGDFGWKLQARKYGTNKKLKQNPYKGNN